MDFIDDNGLVNSRPDEVHAENASLWTLEYIVISRMFNVNCADKSLALHNFCEECKIRTGLYNQRDFMEEDGCPENYMSHDQLTAISAYSFMSGFAWHKHIWDEIKRQHGRYDNIRPDKRFNPFNKRAYSSKERWIHPRDMIYYGILNDVWWCNRLFPVFAEMMRITCRKETETSGKLLALVRCGAASTRLPKFQKLFLELTDIIRDNKTMLKWETAFEIYFPYKNHPIRELIHAQDRNSWLF